MKLKRLGITIVPLAILGVIYLAWPKFSSEYYSLINIPNHEKHRGVCWVGGPNEVSESEIKNLLNTNVNWISQTPFGWQRGHDNPQIGSLHGSGQFNQGWWGERDEGLGITTQYAKKYGIKTILKPHIWLRDEGGKWRGEIKMKSEEDWLKWFANYEDFILHYAKLAEKEQMEMLCIGTELHQTCVEREADWRNLIKKIRTVYSGPITYAANFANEYEEVPFWDALDYIGIQAYFSLTNQEEPSVEILRKGWQQHIKALREFSNRFKKPILFTEVGYKSTKDAGVNPWEWPQRLNSAEREIISSEQTQANCFEALFAEVMDEPWLAGVHIWKWYPHYSQRSTQGYNNFDIDFTPQLKTAQEVIKEGFGQYK